MAAAEGGALPASARGARVTVVELVRASASECVGFGATAISIPTHHLAHPTAWVLAFLCSRAGMCLSFEQSRSLVCAAVRAYPGVPLPKACV
jgi:hypothetical protein